MTKSFQHDPDDVGFRFFHLILLLLVSCATSIACMKAIGFGWIASLLLGYMSGTLLALALIAVLLAVFTPRAVGRSTQAKRASHLFVKREGQRPRPLDALATVPSEQSTKTLLGFTQVLHPTRAR